MRQKRSSLVILATVLALWVPHQQARGQADVPKIELGVHFSSQQGLDLSDFGITFDQVNQGIGGRVTYNLTRRTGLEGEINFLPTDARGDIFTLNPRMFHTAARSQTVEGLFGAKIGARSKRVGVFGKIRPGFLHFTVRDLLGTRPGLDPFPFPDFDTRISAGFALDLGGVMEFYPVRHIVLRVDLGDTMIRFRNQVFLIPGGLLTEKNFTNHNLQVNAGLGFRF